MKSKLTTIFTIILSFLVLGTGVVFAQGTCLSKVDRIPGITLDEAQKTALESKDAEYKKKMIRLKADHAVARVDKDEALKDRNFKKDAVKKQIRKIMDIETEMEITRLDALDELRSILTDEQWEAFKGHMGPHGKFKGKACPRSGKKAHCPAGYGKGKAHGQKEAYAKGMKQCPYSSQTEKP